MTDIAESRQTLRIAVPKGRTEQGVRQLLADARIDLRSGPRGYRPVASVPWLETKVLKPQNIVEMLAAGTRDIGFAGADWVAEKNAELIPLLDTGLDPVTVVAAAPRELLTDGALPKQQLTVATEMVRLTERWIEQEGLDAVVIRSYGATEVFPPEDADMVVDISATGETLSANGLIVVGTVMKSTTQLYASREAIDDPSRKVAIDRLVVSLRAVLEARSRVMVELNIDADGAEGLFEVLPSMRTPTVATLHGGGFSVKAAVSRVSLPDLIPTLKSVGATDIVVSRLEQIVP
ncbi:MAG: ATP phosphoribosyltransferase [Acidimicrobiia bacterium]